MKETAIIIPNYNGMQYLETCLSSLEKQTCREFTIYLVDNGSTDQSRSYSSTFHIIYNYFIILFSYFT